MFRQQNFLADEKLEGFVKYCFDEDISENTIKTYLRDILNYQKWFFETFGKRAEVLYRENIFDYRSYVQVQKKLTANTINKKLSSLRKFNQYLVEAGFQEEIVFNGKENIKWQRNAYSQVDLTEQEVHRFLQSVLEAGDSRDYAIAVFFVKTGMRISEVLDIKLSDVSKEAKEIRVRGKGNKERVVFINTAMREALNAYLKVRGEYRTAANSEYLFVSHKKGKLDRSAVNKLFKKHSIKIHPHSLRHYVADRLLNELEWSLVKVANYLGHSSIKTTQKYLSPRKEEVRQEIELL
jgi:integrase/recombinase XerD